MKAKKRHKQAEADVPSMQKTELDVTVDEKPVPKLPHELDETARGIATPRLAIFTEEKKTTGSSSEI
jgi:hypothetical protein